MTPRILAAAELPDLKLGPVDLGSHDGGFQRASRDSRGADRAGAAAVGQEHLLELDRGAGFDPFAIVDQESFPFLDTELAAAFGNDCKHGFSIVSGRPDSESGEGRPGGRIRQRWAGSTVLTGSPTLQASPTL